MWMERSYQLPFVKDIPLRIGLFLRIQNHPRRKVNFHPAIGQLVQAIRIGVSSKNFGDPFGIQSTRTWTHKNNYFFFQPPNPKQFLPH